jgi:uncharacterized protein YdaU (DUF1376 family)
MNRPWMPLYIADYLADTSHLRAAESGAYLHLIMHYWRNDGLPADDRSLAAIARMTPSEWEDARPLIEPLFKAGTWKHKRIETELAKARQKAEAGRSGGLAKGKRTPSEVPSETISEALSEPYSGVPSTPVTVYVKRDTEEEKEAKKERRRLCKFSRNEIAEIFGSKFWPIYPKREGSNPRAPAAQKFILAVEAGADPAEICAAVVRYAEANRKDIGTRMIAQALTWLNQRRWEDYPPEPQPSTGPPQPPSPDLPSDAELRAKYAGMNGHEGSGIRPEGPRLLQGESHAEPSDNSPRKPGMASLGSVFQLSRLRAVGDADGS